MFLPIILIVRYEFTLLIRYGYETSVIYLFVAVLCGLLRERIGRPDDHARSYYDRGKYIWLLG